MTAQSVLVTGATGFVGEALVTALGTQQRQVRRALHASTPGNTAADIIVGDIGPDTDWRPALQGIDCIVHLAARTHVLNERSADPLAVYRQINVEATRRLAQQAAAARVQRFVFLSSIKVNGESTGEHPFSANDAPQPQDAYGISKREAEDVLRQIGADTGMEIVILRPPLVYGPGVKGNFLRLLQAVARGTPLPLASIKNRRSLVYVGNLVDAIITCMDSPAAAGKTFLVSDGEDVSTPVLIRKLAAALDTTPRLLPCPPTLLHFGAALLGKRAAAMRLTGSLAVDSSAMRQELGWQPRYSMDQGLNATGRWYHQGQN
ncbi:MAG: UDP-glucose 4-epimerase family protein [Betaproteobacteria bacterium]